jgi:hypothetical protein
MGTPRFVSAPRAAAGLALLAAVVAGCGPFGSNSAANHPSPVVSSTPAASPSTQATASPTQAPPPVTGSYGVLYGSQAASSYSVSIVGVDGKVVASADTTTPPSPTCANAAAALVNAPVSMSNSRVYFMDASGGVWTLGPDGTKSAAPVINLPAPSTSRRSMFAVSPDDAEMAVVVDNFTSGGASTQLFMYDLNLGGTQRQLYSQTGSFTLWPIGWHGTNNLVLAKVASCTQGGGPFCCGPLELHVVDPANADRRFTLGNGSTCVTAGPPSPAGAVCENTGTLVATVLNWTAGTVSTYTMGEISFAYLSPDGDRVAYVNNSGTFVNGPGGGHSLGPRGSGPFACTWIDDTHVLSGGDAQHQPVVADAVGGNPAIPVPAQGDCAGRLPGGL